MGVGLMSTAVLSVLQSVRVSSGQEERNQGPAQGGQRRPGTNQVSQTAAIHEQRQAARFYLILMVTPSLSVFDRLPDRLIFQRTAALRPPLHLYVPAGRIT